MKVIKGFDNYFVTDDGRVLNKKKNKFLKPILQSKGYYQVILSRNKIRLTKTIHRLVAEAYLGETSGKQVNHKNGIKTDNRLENLEWVTCSDNLKHAFKNKLSKPHKKKSKIVLNKENGIFYNSATEAAMAFGINKQSLINMLNGNAKNKTSFVYI